MEDLQVLNTLAAKLKLQAAETGVDEDWLTDQALRIVADMPAGLLGTLLNIRDGLSESFNEDVPLHVVVSNKLIDALAWYAARERAGLVKNRPLYEFARIKDKFATGEELLRILVAQYEAEIKAAQRQEDPAMTEIKALIAQGMREGKEVVLGEKECCRCGADLAPAYDLRVQHPGKPAITLRLCKGCAEYVDITYGIFGMIRGKAGEVVQEKI